MAATHGPEGAGGRRDRMARGWRASCARPGGQQSSQLSRRGCIGRGHAVRFCIEDRGKPLAGIRLDGALAGNIFIDRSSRASAEGVALEIAGRLSSRSPYPGVSRGHQHDGTEVLRFHSRLFEPAVAAEAPITPAAVGYAATDGPPEPELCWFGDEPFLPNLWKILGVENVCALRWRSGSRASILTGGLQPANRRRRWKTFAPSTMAPATLKSAKQ